MIRAAIFAGLVWGIVAATDLYDRIVNKREDTDDE